MKLENMFQNVLSLNFEDLVIKVEKDSELRDLRLEEATSKFDIAAESTNKKKKEPALALSAADKAILKSMGLNMKDVQLFAKQVRQ